MQCHVECSEIDKVYQVNERYEGRSIFNENNQVNPKVLYLHTS